MVWDQLAEHLTCPRLREKLFMCMYISFEYNSEDANLVNGSQEGVSSSHYIRLMNNGGTHARPAEYMNNEKKIKTRPQVNTVNFGPTVRQMTGETR